MQMIWFSFKIYSFEAFQDQNVERCEWHRQPDPVMNLKQKKSLDDENIPLDLSSQSDLAIRNKFCWQFIEFHKNQGIFKRKKLSLTHKMKMVKSFFFLIFPFEMSTMLMQLSQLAVFISLTSFDKRKKTTAV